MTTCKIQPMDIKAVQKVAQLFKDDRKRAKNKKCGIYVIIHKPTQQFYIGQSVNIGSRWLTHTNDLSSQHHSNKLLQSIWNSDSDIKNWEFKIIMNCQPYELDVFEAHYIIKGIYLYGNKCVNSDVEKTRCQDFYTTCMQWKPTNRKGC